MTHDAGGQGADCERATATVPADVHPDVDDLPVLRPDDEVADLRVGLGQQPALSAPCVVLARQEPLRAETLIEAGLLVDEVHKAGAVEPRRTFGPHAEWLANLRFGDGDDERLLCSAGHC